MAEKGFGIVFQYTTDDGTTWLPIASLEDATPPSESKDTIETTNHGSVGGVREFIGGLVDSGEGSLDIQYDPADTGHIELRTRAATAFEAPEKYRFVFADTGATIDEFTAVCTGFTPKSELEGKLMASVSFKASGVITHDAT